MKRIFIAFSFVFILVAIAITAPEKAATSTTEHKVVNPADLQWGDAPPGLPPGAKLAVLNGDPNKAGSFTVRVKAPAGYKVPPHTHPTDERLTISARPFTIG